jgi:hypothetical protein
MAAPLAPAIPDRPVRRFTVEEYHRLADCGVLVDREPFELIHGFIVQKMTIQPPHSSAVNALMELLSAVKGSQATVRIQQPITLVDSEPEPDVVLAVGSRLDYSNCHPSPAHVLILAEVADSSLAYDRTTKLELYAQARVAVYWIVNLIDRQVEVYTQPRVGKTPSYRKQTNYGPGEDVPVVIDGKTIGRIPVAELLP